MDPGWIVKSYQHRATLSNSRYQRRNKNRGTERDWKRNALKYSLDANFCKSAGKIRRFSASSRGKKWLNLFVKGSRSGGLPRAN